MKRATDKLVALQFLAVALPITVVLLVQLAADARRAASLDHSRPLRILAEQARENYKTFMNGAADAVDTNTLGPKSVEALRTAGARLADLRDRGEGPIVREAAGAVRILADIIPAKGATLNTLLPLRERIMQGDALTKAIDDEFEKRDEFVVKDAIASAAIQKRAVAGALFITAILTVLFVLATRRRLKARMEADIAKERHRRAELETISTRFGIATRAARAGAYELKCDGQSLWWSDTMHELYAQSPATFQPTLASWLELIHPDDRAAAQTAITGAIRDNTHLRSQYRIVRPDGSVCHVASLAAVATDVDLGPRLVGIDLDITDRVEADERERKLQHQLRDASRQAGMAEIATNVLHNVGNVLNSVNISASLVEDRVKKPRAAGLSKVVGLLKQNEADLGTFVSADERGKHLPFYLSQLSEHLLLDQKIALQELESLRKNIDHIKEIVSMQQSYSKLVGVPERLAVASLVDDALRMNMGAFNRHGVSVKCEFEDVPEIVVEKHKVLQILVNLLRNAKYACESAERENKHVDVRISRHPDGVQISVADNGVGILAEHMTRIFSHGFTTKKDGHGFGLHSGALAAREMGGALRVDSAGPGSGATFTLQLPLRSPETIDA